MYASNSVWVNFLGAEIKFVQGAKYRTRMAEAGNDKPETVIMVHGGGGHLETFTFNLVPLSQYFHLIALDMLWHGLSDGPEIGEDRHGQVADQIIEVMDVLGLDKVWLVGEAGGAVVVSHLLLRNADRLKGVVFESGSGVRLQEGTVPPSLPPLGGISMNEREMQLLKNPTWQGVKERLLMVMDYQHSERVTDELVDIRLAHLSRPSTNEALTRYSQYYFADPAEQPRPTEEDIGKVQLPVLVIWSEGGGAPHPDAGRRLASLIPGAQFKLLPETGYWAHWEKPTEFNEAVRQFIMGETVT